MPPSSSTKRQQAVLRGLEFLYSIACDAESFDIYGYDLLFCFHWISSTSKDTNLQRTARKMGRERARQWRREHPVVPADADADVVTHIVFGNYSANRLGIIDNSLKPHIMTAAARFSPHDYFWFDPATEPPPRDVPDNCECGAFNPRGRRICRKCKSVLSLLSPYEVWLVALIRSYIGERYGVVLGARYSDVIKWLPFMRPYGAAEDENQSDFIWSVYAVTHIIYTLNGYHTYSLSPQWLPDEFVFLKRNLYQVIAMGDVETAGEMVDSLKSFSLTDRQPLIRDGMEYLLSMQNADGSWGDANAEDTYDRYHTTLTAINGLRDYARRKTRLTFPKLKPLLQQWAVNKD